MGDWPDPAHGRTKKVTIAQIVLFFFKTLETTRLLVLVSRPPAPATRPITAARAVPQFSSVSGVDLQTLHTSRCHSPAWGRR